MQSNKQIYINQGMELLDRLGIPPLPEMFAIGDDDVLDSIALDYGCRALMIRDYAAMVVRPWGDPFDTIDRALVSKFIDKILPLASRVDGYTDEDSKAWVTLYFVEGNAYAAEVYMKLRRIFTENT